MLPEIIVGVSALLLIYTYLGYSLLISFLILLKNRTKKTVNGWTPKVTVVIAARNESQNIAGKLENTLKLDYPGERLEIIVASDASEDATEEIARGYSSKGVKVVRIEPREGKTAAQNAAVRESTGEIIVFSDATTYYQPDVLQRLVQSYDSEGRVGCVSGRVIFQQQASKEHEEYRHYWNWECKLQMQESRLGFLPGAVGCLYSVRRAAFVFLPPYAISDFLQPASIGYNGYEVIFQPAAISLEWREQGLIIDYVRRRRTIARALNGLSKNLHLLNPFKNGFRAIQILSHKVFRWFGPLFIVSLVTAAQFSAAPHLAGSAMILFLLLVVLGLIGIAARNTVVGRGLRIPAYFVLANLSSLLGIWDWIRGQHYITWEPQR